MPGRAIPLVTGEIYHVFNRGIDRRPTFLSDRDYEKAKEAILFYRFVNPPVKLSRFLDLEPSEKGRILNNLMKMNSLVEIYCYCLMPNHFHLLLRQNENGGTSKFLSNFQNSYTRYFNVRHERVGSLFMDQFKAVRVESERQLIHLSRYIHLNPFTGHLVDNFESLEKYPWSSFSEFLGDKSVVDRDFVLGLFQNNREKYRKFVLDNADYQRKMKEIEHLILEHP